MLLRVFYRPRLRDPGAQACQFEHFVVGDFRQLASLGHDPWIGGIDALHVRVDLAFVRVERTRQGDRCQIAAASSQRRLVAGLGDALVSRDHGDHVVVKCLTDAIRFHAFDLGSQRREVLADEPGLPACEDACRVPHVVQRDGQQRVGYALAGYHEERHVPLVRLFRNLSSKVLYFVGCVSHR